MFGIAEQTTVCGLFSSWGGTARVATFVVVVLAMVVVGLWVLPLEISAGPVRLRR